MKSIRVLAVVFVVMTAALAAAGENGIGTHLILLRSEATVEELDAFIAELSEKYGVVVTSRYTTSMRAVGVQVDAGHLPWIASHPLVTAIEENRPFRIGRPGFRVQTNAVQNFPGNWGLDRVDQRYLPLNQQYAYSGAGYSVHMYIVDSGIYRDSPAFTGRLDLVALPTFGGSQNFAAGPNFTDSEAAQHRDYVDDCYGHGTAVANFAAGFDDGIAKEARVHVVRVIDCNGNVFPENIASGLEWVANYARTPAVVNLSINKQCGSQISNCLVSIQQQINRLIERGITVVASVGNVGAVGPLNMPGSLSVPGLIIVGATDMNDNRTALSHDIDTVEIYAPGAQLRCPPWAPGTRSYSCAGTSFAAPHVAGYAAVLKRMFLWMTPAQIEAVIVSNGTPVVMNRTRGSNRLLYTQ